MERQSVNDQQRFDALSRLAEQFSRIADTIEARQPDSRIAEVLNATLTLCAEAAPRAPAAETSSLLANLQTALETWQTVWLRLGSQQEFRQAVTREARLWEKKLRTLAVHD